MKLTKEERKYYEEAVKRGYMIRRGGWPDFLLVPTRKVEGGSYKSPFCTEVKKGNAGLSQDQRALQNVLHEKVLPVMISKNGSWIDPSGEYEFSPLISSIKKTKELRLLLINLRDGVLYSDRDFHDELRDNFWKLFKLVVEIDETLQKIREEVVKKYHTRPFPRYLEELGFYFPPLNTSKGTKWRPLSPPERRRMGEH